jgi:D-alanyl-lipoteichoic acid acyltransferase DltB (MBOAT superfamily)
MLFHSQIFLLLFLPLALAAYYAYATRPTLRRWILIVASILFYGYWDVRLVPLLVGSVTGNWLIAYVATRTRGRTDPGRYLPWIGVAFNLLLLGIFKYADFFADSLAAVLGSGHRPWNIILPLGISFFTFQQISYLVDLRRGEAPLYAFTDYALYVSFFPQLIAGPIVRHHEVILQYRADPWRDGLYERLSRGLALLILGLIKKVIIADGLALIADPIYARAGGAAGPVVGFADGWLAALGFTFQLYFDFSGYTDMAIGLALMFGFVLPINFDIPYRATSIRGFWRRWHMTLSRFLRDYLYIPLGGSRRGAVVQTRAALITMLLGGLWHGAGWTYVAWGGLHGVALIVNHLWRRTGLRLPAGLAWALTMLFVIAGWVLFRAEDFAAALNVLEGMAGLHGPALDAVATVNDLWLLPTAAVLAIAGPTGHRLAHEIMPPRRLAAAALAMALVFVTLTAGGGDNAVFIYFQF